MTGFWKVFGAAALVVAVGVAVVGTLAYRIVQDLAAETTRRQIMGECALLASAARDADDLQTEVERLAAQLPGRRFTIVDPEGVVLADSEELPERMDNHADRPEILAAREAREPLLRFSHTVQRDLLYYAAPIAEGGARQGYARVALPAADVNAQATRLRQAVLLSAMAALAVGLLAAGLFARGMRKPLDDISGFVGAVARGEKATRLSPARSGDLRPLATAVNAMADQLDERFARILRDQVEIRAVLGSMVEGVLAVDQDQRIVLLNSAAATLLETREEDARGRLIWEVTRIPQISGLLASCRAERRRCSADVVVPGHAHDLVVRVTASPLGEGSSAWGIVLVLHDLTEIRRLENIRRDFVVNVSHELKTPLTAMRGFVEAILDNPAMDEETRGRFLIRARQNTDRMVAIVSDLLTLARIEAEDGALRKDPVDLREVCRECQEDASGAAAARDATVTLDTPPETLTVVGDRAALATAVMNLLDNAIKYGPQGGAVRLAAGRTDGTAWIEVTDQGPGIPSHETERIFERFYRVDKNRSRELGGTGLGLSIVKNVVLAHGGQVSVDSSPGRGSTFRLRIPLKP